MYPNHLWQEPLKIEIIAFVKEYAYFLQKKHEKDAKQEAFG